MLRVAIDLEGDVQQATEIFIKALLGSELTWQSQ